MIGKVLKLVCFSSGAFNHSGNFRQHIASHLRKAANSRKSLKPVIIDSLS